MATLIAGGIALWNENRKRRQERDVENRKHSEERDRTKLTGIRLSAAEVFKEMFVLQHEVEWLTWHALYNPNAVDERMLGAYDNAVHASIQKLLGSLAVLASLDKMMYDNLALIAEELFAFEGDTAKVTIAVREPESRESAIQALAARFVPAEALWRGLPLKMAAVMEGGRTSTDSM